MRAEESKLRARGYGPATERAERPPRFRTPQAPVYHAAGRLSSSFRRDTRRESSDNTASGQLAVLQREQSREAPGP